GGFHGSTRVGHELCGLGYSTIPAHQGFQHDRIAIYNVVTFGTRSAREQLIAGDQERHGRTPNHRNPGCSDRGEDTEILRPEYASCLYDDVACFDILAPTAHM